MMKSKNILIFIFLFFAVNLANAQTIIRGVITDASTGEVLIGATVVQIDKSNRYINGTITDVSGNYSIKISGENPTLGFSYIGYEFMTIEAGSRKEINIELVSQTSELEEVVVTAERSNPGDGLSNIAVRDLATSVAAVDMSELSEMPVSSVAEALQGRISGVDISFNSGDPGAGMSIKIRGNTSLNGNSQPLIILDGVPYETSIGTDFNFQSADVADFGSLVDLSPSDIKSIQILKDAASTAVWGSKAANGVIVITTKRGVTRKTQFNLDYRGSYVFEPEPLPMLNGDQYVRLVLDSRFNRNPAYTSIPAEFQNNPSSPDYYNFNNNTDWVRAVTRNGSTNDLNFSVSGGGDKARYRASVGYYDQVGSTIGTGLQRVSTRLNLDYKISNRLKLTSDFSYTNSDKDQNYYDGESWASDRQVRALAYRKAPHMSIYEYDPDGNLTGNYFSPETSDQGSGLNYLNPVALAMDGIKRDVKDRVLTNFQLEFSLLAGLKYYANVSFDIANNKNTQLLPQSATGVSMGNTSLNRAKATEDFQNIIQTFNKLIYTPDLGNNHELMLLGMFSTYDKFSSQMGLISAGMPSYSLYDPSNIGIEDAASSAQSRIRTLSYLFNTHYVFKDKYILGGGIRVDGDSRFGPNNRYGYFPSLSAAWRISSESFMSSYEWLSDFKIRTSYGVNGYSTQGSYQYLAKYQSSGGYLDMNGIRLSNVQLNNLKWETTTQVDYGFDLSLFNYRLTVNFDVYDKYTKDIIFNSLSIPSTSGFSSMTSNWGEMRNKGWEFNLSSNILKRENFDFNFDFNISQNQNIIERIPENYSNEIYSVSNGEYARRILEGYPIGAFYGYQMEGTGVYSSRDDLIAYDEEGKIILNPSTGEPLPPLISGNGVNPGDAHYKDINYDGKINELDIVYLGNANPDVYGGFGLNFRYKRVTFSSYYNYKIGQDVINETRMYSENMYSRDNQSTAVLRRWRKEGDVTDIPRALYAQGYNWLGSDRFVEDASFLRMRTLTLAYQVRSEALKEKGISQLKTYITGYNLFTLTNYTGQDPEVGFSGSDPFAVGKDRSKTPPPVNITVGISLLF
jgi:TonB-linked SusC/RagA family outer membrane protein